MKILHSKSLIENGNIHINVDLGVNSTIIFSNYGSISSDIDTDDNILVSYIYIIRTTIVNRKYMLSIKFYQLHTHISHGVCR